MRLKLVMLMALMIAMSAQPALAGKGRGDDSGRSNGRGQMTAAQAADVARRQTGGRVLAVQSANGGYRVKVLTGAGEVRQVFVPGSGR